MIITNYGICQVSIAPLRSAASDEAEIVTQLLFGDYVEVIDIGQPWIKIYFAQDDYYGFMDFKQLLYISTDEYEENSSKKHPVVSQGQIKINGPIGIQHVINGSNLPSLENQTFKLNNVSYDLIETYQPTTKTLIETALTYLNTPYLWGGKGIYGIDCSGFTQVVAKIHDIKLPRDASKQVNVGKLIAYENRRIGDLMYFVNSSNKVHHVGFLTAANEIIHAAGYVRIDRFDEVGIFREDLNKYTHKFHSIRRI